MKISFFLFMIAALAGMSCQSKTQKNAPEEPESFGMVIATPKVIAKDWPLTREEHELLTNDVQNGALDPKALEFAGLHSRKEITDFAHRVLKMDLAPIARDMTPGAYYLVPLGAYTLLGYYGSQEDARQQFEAVKGIDGNRLKNMPKSEYRGLLPIIETLGYYLMRDHLMPQKDRDWMIEIEDYLYKCSELNAPSCWPYEGRETSNDQLRIDAFDAVAYGCGARAMARAKAYAAETEGSIYEVFGNDALKTMSRVDSMTDLLRKQLPPVLPESEIDR